MSAELHNDLPSHIRALDGPEARRRLAAAEREAQLWLAIAKVPISLRILDEVRYRLGMIAAAASYAVRPFDAIGDCRRWWWQRPARCGWTGLSPETRRYLASRVTELLAEDDVEVGR